MAGLWDVSIKEDGTRVESCAVITVPANKGMDVIDGTDTKTAGSHDGCVPAILTRAAQEAWQRGSPADAEACLKPYDDALTIAHRVSSRVNSPKNNDEGWWSRWRENRSHQGFRPIFSPRAPGNSRKSLESLCANGVQLNEVQVYRIDLVFPRAG